MRREILIALLAIITGILAIWGFKFLSGENLFGDDNTYYTIVDNAKEINTATKVLINGYQVGTVTSITPNPDDIRDIKIAFQVKKEIALPNYTKVQLRNEGVMGGKEFELVFDKYCNGSNCAQDGALLECESIGLLGSIITKDDLEPKIQSITSSIDRTIGKLGARGNDTPLDNTIRDLSHTMDNLSSSTARFSSLMNSSAKDLEVTLSNMAVLTESLVNSTGKLSTVLNDVSKLTADMSKISLSETINKSNATIDQAGVSFKALEGTLTDASSTVQELNSLLNSIDSKEGTLGLLLHDKQLHDDLQSTMKNMDLLLQDVRLNPRRYLKVFGKKVPDYELPENDPAQGK